MSARQIEGKEREFYDRCEILLSGRFQAVLNGEFEGLLEGYEDVLRGDERRYLILVPEVDSRGMPKMVKMLGDSYPHVPEIHMLLESGKSVSPRRKVLLYDLHNRLGLAPDTRELFEEKNGVVYLK